MKMIEHIQENKVKLVLHFANGSNLKVDTYSSIDISRNKNDYNINLSNIEGDFTFNNLYDEVLEKMGEDKFFDVTVQKNDTTINTSQMTAHYYSSGEREVLTITKHI